LNISQVHSVVLKQCHALRIARRTRCKAHTHHIDRRHANAIRLVDLRRVMHDLGKTDHIGCVDVVDADRQRQFRQARTQLADHRKVVEALESACTNVRLRLRELEDVLDFRGAEVGTDLVCHCADEL
jgi:hypothetical protein